MVDWAGLNLFLAHNKVNWVRLAHFFLPTHIEVGPLLIICKKKKYLTFEIGKLQLQFLRWHVWIIYSEVLLGEVRKENKKNKIK